MVLVMCIGLDEESTSLFSDRPGKGRLVLYFTLGPREGLLVHLVRRGLGFFRAFHPHVRPTIARLA